MFCLPSKNYFFFSYHSWLFLSLSPSYFSSCDPQRHLFSLSGHTPDSILYRKMSHMRMCLSRPFFLNFSQEILNLFTKMIFFFLWYIIFLSILLLDEKVNLGFSFLSHVNLDIFSEHLPHYLSGLKSDPEPLGYQDIINLCLECNFHFYSINH